MSGKALIVVDVQNDFCDDGALPIKGGYDVAWAIKNHLLIAWRDYDRIIFTRDWHRSTTDNGGHFALKPDYVDTWPAHCLAESHGAEYANDGLAGFVRGGDHKVTEILKGWDEPAYSGFEGIAKDGTTLVQKLYGISQIEVCGLAFDYCVAATALDARRDTPAIVTVLTDLTASVSRKTELKAAHRMARFGVTLA